MVVAPLCFWKRWARSISISHTIAREADPAARLVINDYNLEFHTPEDEARRNALLKLFERMRRSGTPVDAVGIEGHLTAASWPPLSATRLGGFSAISPAWVSASRSPSST